MHASEVLYGIMVLDCIDTGAGPALLGRVKISKVAVCRLALIFAAKRDFGYTNKNQPFVFRTFCCGSVQQRCARVKYPLE